MISLAAATATHARLALLRLRRGRLFWVCLGLLALPVLVTAALAAAGSWGRGLFDEVLEIYFRFLLPFVPALLAAPCISDEIDAQTYTFVFARPAPRAALVLGKYLAVVVPLAVVVAVALPLVFGVTMIRFPGDAAGQLGHLARVGSAALLAIAGFAALATACGALFTRHPFVGVVGYLLLVEAGLGTAPIVLNLAALSWHLRNVGDLPRPDTFLLAVSVPVWVSLLVAVALPALFLGGAALLVRDAEYR
jgi:ABC-type transport system involved in multi-copper enzyme maturation permease subunit